MRGLALGALENKVGNFIDVEFVVEPASELVVFKAAALPSFLDQVNFARTDIALDSEALLPETISQVMNTTNRLRSIGLLTHKASQSLVDKNQLARFDRYRTFITRAAILPAAGLVSRSVNKSKVIGLYRLNKRRFSRSVTLLVLKKSTSKQKKRVIRYTRSAIKRLRRITLSRTQL